MDEPTLPEVEPSIPVNFRNTFIIIVFLIPLSYALYETLKPSLPFAGVPAAAIKATIDDPNFDTYLNLGLTYYNAKQFDDAIISWTKALEFNHNSPLVYSNIAAAYGCQSNWEEQMKYCEKALAISPDFSLAINNLAWAKDELAKQKSKQK